MDCVFKNIVLESRWTLAGRISEDLTFDCAGPRMKGKSEFRGDADLVLLTVLRAEASRTTCRKGNRISQLNKAVLLNIKRSDYE